MFLLVTGLRWTLKESDDGCPRARAQRGARAQFAAKVGAAFSCAYLCRSCRLGKPTEQVLLESFVSRSEAVFGVCEGSAGIVRKKAEFFCVV
jgi:hypothetical protein